jgi:hypothetical protein
MEILAVLLIGMTAGILSTVFGLGGGVVMVPVLTLVTTIGHLEAMATSLGAIFFIAIWNTLNYTRRGLVVWSVVGWLALGSGSFSFSAACIAPHLPERWLVAIMMGFLGYLAVRTFMIGPVMARGTGVVTAPGAAAEPAVSGSAGGAEQKRIHPALSFGIGALSGTVSGFTGIGGGGVTTPLMLVAGLVENRTAAPTSNAVMIFTAGAGAFSYAFTAGGLGYPCTGLIHLDYSLLLAAGAVLSSYGGMRLNNIVSLHVRKIILGAILVLITIRLGWQVFGAG